VALNLRTILKNISFCKEDILNDRPDALILVDYPGFNLRIAEFAKEKAIKVFYYISPQVWAWKQSRVHKIKKVVDHMFVILPFEKSFYKRFFYKVDFVGHPLLDAINEEQKKTFPDFARENHLQERPIIALLPGSRRQEISVMLPLMLSIKDKFPQYQLVIAGAPSQQKEFYEPFISGTETKLLFGKTYELLQHSTAALVTSGTATLETALFNVPEVVCYKGGKISFMIAKQLVKVKYISLVNLIMDREVVKELIQNELTEENIAVELEKILEEDKRKKILSDYSELRSKLGGKGASERTARLISKYLGIK
jgi:lipid-A-disaccharide synthase